NSLRIERGADGATYASFVVEAVASSDGSAAEGSGASLKGKVKFEALASVWVPRRRTPPMKELKREDFQVREFNVASEKFSDIRGLLLSSEKEITRLESTQTLMENQVVLTNKVRRIPDIRRGDAVRVKLVS